MFYRDHQIYDALFAFELRSIPNLNVKAYWMKRCRPCWTILDTADGSMGIMRVCLRKYQGKQMCIKCESLMTCRQVGSWLQVVGVHCSARHVWYCDVTAWQMTPLRHVTWPRMTSHVTCYSDRMDLTSQLVHDDDYILCCETFAVCFVLCPYVRNRR